MILILIYLNLCIFPIDRAERPLSVCPTWEPFRTSENRCANFNDVCVKKGDPDCDAFQGACQQCPALNYSILTYREVIKLKDQIQQDIRVLQINAENMAKTIKKIDEEDLVTIKQILGNSNKKDNLMTNLLITEIVIIISMFVCLIIEIRFKLLTKFIEGSCNRGKYQILQSRKSKNIKDLVTTEILDNKLSSLNLVTTSILDEKLSSLNLVTTSILDEKLSSLSNKMFFAKFKINGVKKIDLELSLNDSIVEIKKRICRKWSASELHSYKIMTLKQNGRVIDNNQFCSQKLLSDIIECEVDSSSNYEQIVSLQIRAKFDVPKLIQIGKNKTIAELKQIIYKFTNSRDIALLNEREELKDESSIEDCALRDDDVVTVVERKKGELVIRSILEYQDQPIKIVYSNTDKTFSIYDQIAKDLNCRIDFIFLFFKDELLDKDEFVYECGIKRESIIKYYHLQKLNGIRPGRTIDKGYNSEVLEGRDTTTNSDLMLMKYALNLADFKPDEETIKTLFEHQFKNRHPLFLQLHGIYTDEENLYVGFEYMKEGTLTNYLDNHPVITNGQIWRWSKQILEYLRYIHSNGCIYIDLKPYDLFVYAYNNLKMHNDAIRCFYDKNPNDKIDHMLKNKSEQLIYLAPEVRDKKPYDKRADIWSFGVIVLHMATGELPKIDWTQIRSGNLQYELPFGRSEELKNLIDSCVKIDPDERATIDKLLRHKYFNNLIYKFAIEDNR